MSGRLTVIGIGPGGPDHLTLQASQEIARARYLFGYQPYLARLVLSPEQTCHASDNRQELARAGKALDVAASGEQVAMISGGDPGVFAMAAAVCEAIETGPSQWRELELTVIPGVTAMLAVAATVGAPLGHDFCALSLSDNLKPWDLIAKRLTACAGAGLVLALYNPISKARPWQLPKTFELLREILPSDTLVIFGRAAGRDAECSIVQTLATADAALADMATCIIIGSAQTRLVERPGQTALVYSPRFAKDVSQ